MTQVTPGEAEAKLADFLPFPLPHSAPLQGVGTPTPIRVLGPQSFLAVLGLGDG